VRKFSYVDQGDDGVTPVHCTISEDKILCEYFPYWHEQMKKVGKASKIITHAYLDQCIDDFCVVHWATEIKDVA
jgi:hypothetical protein